MHYLPYISKKHLFISVYLLVILHACSFLFPPEQLDESDIPPIDPTTLYPCPQIRIRTSTATAKKLTATTPDMEKHLCMLEYQGYSYNDVLVSLHGISTLFTRRHSYNVNFTHSQCFIIDSMAMPFFYLISMANDPGYLESLLGYTILSDLQLFIPYFTAVEVLINNQTQGMYLLIERTADAVLRKQNDIEFVMRRSNDDDYTIEYYLPKNSQKTLTRGDYILAHQSLYTLHEIYSQERLYQELSCRMAINGYMQWLAVNTFLQNGDYNDEVFFYAFPALNSEETMQPFFRISAWDYDDLFMPPHWGLSIPGSLVYCNQNTLDEAIAKDAFLYSKFLALFRDLLGNTLTEAYLSELFAGVETNNAQYLKREAILSIQNNLTGTTGATWEDYAAYYRLKLSHLCQRRKELLAQLIQK